jgi:pimeloyl-ACP methyl ester carboxylesterase
MFGHVLRISDPSLFLSEWINGSCFFGTEPEDPIPAIVECSRVVAQQLSVSENRVVYFGHSGGGFGAIQCAFLDRASSALAINPVLEPAHYAKYNFAKAMAEIFRPNADIAELLNEYPERLSVRNAMKSAHAAGVKPCIGIIQNVLDSHHYGKHFVPFCKAVGIGPLGGTDATGFIQGMTCILRGAITAGPWRGMAQ